MLDFILTFFAFVFRVVVWSLAASFCFIVCAEAFHEAWYRLSKTRLFSRHPKE